MPYQLESKQPFSSSLLWGLQRRYFEETGFEAWRRGEVPHYITSNPRIAAAYAQMVIALYKDTIATAGGSVHQPFYIAELGGGSGRFAFYLMKSIVALSEQENIPVNSFKYILTDFTQSNLDFWRIHPCLQIFFEDGLMDIALFDATQKNNFHMQLAGVTIGPGQLQNPLCVVANYLFDSIPQELFYCKDKQALPCLVSITTDTEDDPAELTAAEILENLSVDYHYANDMIPFFSHGPTEKILDHYREHFEQAYVFIPDRGIRCMEHLQSFSNGGMMLLSSDKGHHMEEFVSNETPPGIVKHGSFSLSVNYHALKMYAEYAGAKVMFPGHLHGSIHTGCFLFVKNARRLVLTQNTFQQYFSDSGPDDYYNVYTFFRDNPDIIPFHSIVSALRISLYDSHQLEKFLPGLMRLAKEMEGPEKKDVIEIIGKCWENYYPLGEGNDLANKIASFLYEIDAYISAISYFRLSSRLYGNDTATVYNLAVCYYMTGEFDNSIELLKRLVGNGNDSEVLDLLQQCERAAG